ncbi:starch-binding protein, partial [Klebsiella pneumoniae]|nr:starch-binding protein [Klebsiella pneumoniae]
YCQMPYDWWWAGDDQGNHAAISLYAYGEGVQNAEWPGVLMTEVDEANHIWSIEADLSAYTHVIFARSCKENNDNWGAKTGDLLLSERGENDMYVI